MKVILKKKTIDPWSKAVATNGFYPNCRHQISTYFKRSGKRYTGFESTPEDRERLENLLGYDLRPDSSFWDNFSIDLSASQDTVTLDTTIPFDEFRYKFLKEHKRVANGLSDKKQTAEYILIEETATAEEVNRKAQIKIRAMKEYGLMTVEQMKKALRLYGHKSENVNNEVVQSTLFTLVEASPEQFISLWVDNVDKDTQYLIEEAVANNILRKSKTVYKYGTDVIGYTLEEAIDYLKEPTNRDLRLTIQNQIEGKRAALAGEIVKEKRSEYSKIKDTIKEEVND